MGLSEYKRQLECEIRESIYNILAKERSVVIGSYYVDIKELLKVRCKVRMGNINLKRLLSGEVLTLIVVGEIDLLQEVTGRVRWRRIKFWIRPCVIRYKTRSRRFEVVDMSDFIPVDFLG